jgi:hypothetical protein
LMLSGLAWALVRGVDYAGQKYEQQSSRGGQEDWAGLWPASEQPAPPATGQRDITDFDDDSKAGDFGLFAPTEPEASNKYDVPIVWGQPSGVAPGAVWVIPLAVLVLMLVVMAKRFTNLEGEDHEEHG